MGKGKKHNTDIKTDLLNECAEIQLFGEYFSDFKPVVAGTKTTLKDKSSEAKSYLPVIVIVNAVKFLNYRISGYRFAFINQYCGKSKSNLFMRSL